MPSLPPPRHISTLPSFREYRELWLDSRERVMSWSDPTVTHYPRAIAATWQTSVAQLTEVARRLLEQLAWLAPEPVPEFLLKVPIPPPSRRHKFLGFNFALWKARPQHIDHQALQELIAYSLATRHAVESQFSLHRLVQDVTRRSLGRETHRLRLGEALRWINAACVGAPDEFRNSPRLDPLVPHARAVIGYAEDSGIVEPTVTLMTRLGVLLLTKGLYSDAEALHRRVLVIGENSLGPDHPEMVFALNNLGLSMHATNRLAEAEPLLRRALAITEIKLGPKHPRVGVHLNNLALLLRDDGRPAEAESLMRRALAIDENSFGPDYPRVAAYLNNLGQLLRLTNRIAESEPLLRRALAIEEKNFGPAHPNTAARMLYLGELLRANAQLVEAEPLLRRSLAIEEESFGPDHPEVAICLTSLGQLLRDTNRLREAEPLLRRAATIFADFEKKTGHRHPNHDTAERSYLPVLDPSGKPGSEAGRCRRRP
jgi:tetratricopeptide (TPR) repeat protein